VDDQAIRHRTDPPDRAAVAWAGPFARLRIRAKLYLAFSAISVLVIASAFAAIAWVVNSDADLRDNLALAAFAERQSTVVELELMTMSDAIRGYLLDPSSQAEIIRKRAADDELSQVVAGLETSLATMPNVLRLINEIERYDDQTVNRAEDHLIELAAEDADAAKRAYQTDYMPMREHEIELVLSLRREVGRVKDAIQAEAVRTRVRQLRIGCLGAVGLSLLSWLLARLCARAIGDQIRAMTAAMGRLASGDTTIEIPAQAATDEIGDMARAVEVFRANLIAHRQGEIALRQTNLQFDAALNSMLLGMIMFGPDHRVQLVNARYYAVTGARAGSIVSGLTMHQVIDVTVAQGSHSGEDPGDICDKIATLLAARRSMQFETEMRSGLFVQIAAQPVANGGSVVTFEDVSEKRRSEAQIVFMARHDALTGLPNRRVFQDHIAAMLDAGGNGRWFALFCLDLDHFKTINDTLGHPAGDELLRQVAARLRGCVRDSDLIARLGGDEFAIVATGLDGDPALATELASRVVEAIATPYEVHGQSIAITTSIGIALHEPGLSGADMLKRADVALYRAKEERGTFAFFESGMDQLLQARVGLEADLRLALQRGEFELNYQPLYNLGARRVTAFEALIRWNSPTRGWVAPDEFIRLAEQSGLIIPIGEWVLRAACAEAASWPDHVGVAVNLSANQTKNQDLVALVRDALERTGLPPPRLELEITEGVLLQDSDTVMTMLRGLHDMGVKIAMDDFGTGYSSLSYLHRFPFDKVKIDRSFVRDLCEASRGREGAADILAAAATTAAMIVRTIVALGENLGISTTAEGVETAQQLAQLRQIGCTEVQGYFISPARPASAVAGLLAWTETDGSAQAKTVRDERQIATSVNEHAIA
jgi:diguanylate cyclase (GGDEF)-like protein